VQGFINEKIHLFPDVVRLCKNFEGEYEWAPREDFKDVVMQECKNVSIQDCKDAIEKIILELKFLRKCQSKYLQNKSAIVDLFIEKLKNNNLYYSKIIQADQKAIQALVQVRHPNPPCISNHNSVVRT
jgi:hypothetical protein